MVKNILKVLRVSNPYVKISKITTYIISTILKNNLLSKNDFKKIKMIFSIND